MSIFYIVPASEVNNYGSVLTHAHLMEKENIFIWMPAQRV